MLKKHRPHSKKTRTASKNFRGRGNFVNFDEGMAIDASEEKSAKDCLSLKHIGRRLGNNHGLKQKHRITDSAKRDRKMARSYPSEELSKPCLRSLSKFTPCAA